MTKAYRPQRTDLLSNLLGKWHHGRQGHWNKSIGGLFNGHKAELVERTSDCYSTGVGSKGLPPSNESIGRGGRDMLRPGHCLDARRGFADCRRTCVDDPQGCALCLVGVVRRAYQHADRPGVGRGIFQRKHRRMVAGMRLPPSVPATTSAAIKHTQDGAMFGLCR